MTQVAVKVITNLWHSLGRTREQLRVKGGYNGIKDSLIGATLSFRRVNAIKMEPKECLLAYYTSVDD